MLAAKLSNDLKTLARSDQLDDPSPDSLIGVFQQLRPDGEGLADLLETVPRGAEVAERLLQVYSATNAGGRSDGARDAYFIARQPPACDPVDAKLWAGEFFTRLSKVADHLGVQPLKQYLSPVPTLRVLEGKPPKHPKALAERASLLNAIDDLIPQMSATWAASNDLVATLQPAVYFMACDAFLRDYVLWPWIAATDLNDPFAPYFHLWRHGVKYRIFANEQIDLYLPRVFEEEDGA